MTTAADLSENEAAFWYPIWLSPEHDRRSAHSDSVQATVAPPVQLDLQGKSHGPRPCRSHSQEWRPGRASL